MVNLKTLAVLALGLIAVACDGEQSDAYQVSSEFTGAEFATIKTEVDHLCSINDGRCISVTRHYAHNRIVMADIGDYDGTFTVSKDGRKVVTLDSVVIDMGYLAQSFRHELGHAAGCDKDSKKTGNVMYSDKYEVSLDVDWSSDDLECINALKN